MAKRYNLGPVKPDCIFVGCDRPQYAHGLCETHNQQRLRGAELKPIRKYRPAPPCGICGDGTPSAVKTSGQPLCRKHHAQWLRGKDVAVRTRNDLRPMIMKMISEWVATRDRSTCWLDWAERPEWEGFDGGGTVSRGYPTIGRDRVMRLVLAESGRPIPPAPANHGLHGCDNTLCLNPDHLRWGTHEENMADLQAVRNYCRHCPHCNSGQ